LACLVGNCVIITGCGVATNPSEKFQKLLPRAEAGSSDAQYEVGRCYLDGNGVATDVKEAAKWFFRAAERGDFRAEGYLASIYVEGRGAPINLDEAIKWWRLVLQRPEGREWWRKAAEKDDPRAEYFWGITHLFGTDRLPSDPKVGKLWLGKA